jgi:hypothetical protein
MGTEAPMNLRYRIALLQSTLPATGTRDDIAPTRLRTPADVLAVLEEQINAVRADPRIAPVNRARLIGSLASIAIRAIEANNLVARVEMLEAVLKLRNGDGHR